MHNALELMNTKVQCLKPFILELIAFRGPFLKFTAGTNAAKEKIISYFEVSLANYLMAIRDLIFYRTYTYWQWMYTHFLE